MSVFGVHLSWMSVSITEQISIELASKIGVRIFTYGKCIIDNNRWLDSEKYILCPHQKTKTRPIGKEGQANSIHLYHFTDCFGLDKWCLENILLETQPLRNLIL